jgi:hypothetical protein
MSNLPPKMKNMITLRLGACIEDLPISEVHQATQMCGPNCNLQLLINEETLLKMFKKSFDYNQSLLKYEHDGKKKTATSKLFTICLR